MDLEATICLLTIGFSCELRKAVLKSSMIYLCLGNLSSVIDDVGVHAGLNTVPTNISQRSYESVCHVSHRIIYLSAADIQSCQILFGRLKLLKKFFNMKPL